MTYKTAARPKIGILGNDQRVAVGSLLRSLRASFHDVTPTRFPLEALPRKSLDKDLDLLILPGCPGDKSPYHDLQTPDSTFVRQGAWLRQQVEDGLHILAICAGMYHIAQQSIYGPCNGDTQIVHPGLGLISGQSAGPLPAYATKGVPGRLPQDGVGIEILGTPPHSAKIAYENGPWIEPKEFENLEVIARYQENGQIAAARKKLGRGTITMTGVLADINPTTHEINDLKPWQEERDLLWKQLLRPNL